MQGAIRAGGFASYKIAVIVANAVAKAVLGRGLSLAANAGLTRAMSIFAGPIGLVITALWTALDLAGPAYRITIPAVIQVAFLRLRHSNTYNVFLAGETLTGKSTIFHILKEGEFAKDLDTKIYKETLDVCGKVLRITGDARKNDEQNIEAQSRFIYVFKADDYLTNAEVKKQVDLDLEAHKELCKKKDCTLKIIGTHKDKCLERGISEDEIKKLESWLGKNGKCQILDLTQFSGEEKQQELCDFIAD